MAEPIIHFTIPFIASLLLKRDYKLALLAGVVGLLPDLDVLIKVHRSMTHSIILQSLFISVIIGVLIVAKVRYWKWILFALAFGLYSHSIMDIFYDYTPILYPLINEDFCVNIYIDVRFTGALFPQLIFNIEVYNKITEFVPFKVFEAALITGSGLVTSLLLLLVAALPLISEVTKATVNLRRRRPEEPRKT